MAPIGEGEGGTGDGRPDRRVGLEDLAHVQAGPLRELATAWLEARGEAAMPQRRAFDPLSVPALMPRLWLCAHDPGTGRFTYRLAGEQINSVYGGSIRGRDLAEVIPASGLDIVERRFRAAIEGPAFVHVIGRIYLQSDRLLVGERLILPLADEAGGARFLLGATMVEGDWHWDTAAPDVARQPHATVTPIAGGPAYEMS